MFNLEKDLQLRELREALPEHLRERFDKFFPIGEQESPDTVKVKVLQTLFLDLISMILEKDVEAQSPRAQLAFALYLTEFEVLCGEASAEEWVENRSHFRYIQDRLKTRRERVRESVQKLNLTNKGRMSYDMFKRLILKFFGG